MSGINASKLNLFYQYKPKEQNDSEGWKAPYVLVENKTDKKEIPPYIGGLVDYCDFNHNKKTKTIPELSESNMVTEEHVTDNLYIQKKSKMISDKFIVDGFEANEHLPKTILEIFPDKEPVCENLTHDKVNEFFVKHAPDLVGSLVPEDYLYMQANTLMLNQTPNAELLKDLPKRADGTYDTEKIHEALEIAVASIKESNKAITDQLDSYGIYKKNLNSLDAWVLLFGPEITGVLENAGWIKEGRTVGIQDIMQLPKILMELGFDVEDEEILEFCDQFLGCNSKSSFEIINNINNQNAFLDELLEIDLESEGGIEKLLNAYKHVTGTGFSYDSIKDYESTMTEENPNNETKMEKFIYAFGSYEQRVDCTMNKITTGIAYEVILKYVVPKILSNCPYTKIVSMFIPLGVEAAETLTAGAKKGQIVNPDALNVGTAMRVAGDGFFHAILVNGFDMGFFTKYFKNIPIPKKLQVAKQFEGLKGFKSFKGIWSKFKQWQYKNAYRGARSGVKGAALGAVEYMSNTCAKLFDKHASTGKRFESFGLNVITGGLFVPAAIINNNEECEYES